MYEENKYDVKKVELCWLKQNRQLNRFNFKEQKKKKKKNRPPAKGRQSKERVAHSGYQCPVSYRGTAMFISEVCALWNNVFTRSFSFISDFMKTHNRSSSTFCNRTLQKRVHISKENHIFQATSTLHKQWKTKMKSLLLYSVELNPTG